MPETVSTDKSLFRPAPPLKGPFAPDLLQPPPWWAQAWAVALVVALWALVHAAISVGLETAINMDDAIENYLVQSFEISYVPRNPPVFDWMLYGVQQLVGPGALSFALLRYGLLFVCFMLVYRVARQAIADPRLQALAVYSLSALWVVGYHSHRLLTHSNVMIVAIAGTMVTMLALVRRPSLGLYLCLGVWIALGVLGKYGYLAFLSALALSSLVEPRFRSVLFDRRILATLLIAVLPVGWFGYELWALKQDVVSATADVIGPDPDRDMAEALDAFAAAWIGYLLPFLALTGLIFLPWNRGEGALKSTPERAAIRRVLLYMIVLGTVGTLIAVVAMGSSSIRDRYFHVFFLFAPVYVFAEAERLGGWQDRVGVYLAVLIVIAVGVVGARVVVPLYPDPRLCGRCVGAEPLNVLRRVVLERLGPAPTLVAADRLSAGRLRAAIPEARVVTVTDLYYRPPYRPATGCGQITGVVNAVGALAPPRMEGTSIDIWAKWWSPLLSPKRESFWQITPLPADSPLCR